MRYAAGVDLGTTYSAAAVFGPGGLAAVDLGIAAMVVPSVVAVRDGGEIVTGVNAQRRLVLEPSRVAREFKRRLGDSAPLLLGGVPYGAETLTGYLLRSVVQSITEREGEPPSVVGLSHPANYGSYRLGLLAEAARVAGVPASVFVPEPVAAAVSYAHGERVDTGDAIAVYDLGGGTFDASVVRSTGDGFELIGRPDGLDRFGGIDMDEAVLGHVRRVLGDDLIDVGHDDPAVVSALARLRDDCRVAKEALSGDGEVEIPVMIPGLHTEVRLTRPEFEDMIRPRIRETIDVLHRTITSAGIEVSEVARVLLVGGSSRIPLVGEMVRAAIGRPVALDAHPKLSTALGTARVAHEALDGRTDQAASGQWPVAGLAARPPDLPDGPASASASGEPVAAEPVRAGPRAPGLGGAAPATLTASADSTGDRPRGERRTRSARTGWRILGAGLALAVVVGSWAILTNGTTESPTAKDPEASSVASVASGAPLDDSSATPAGAEPGGDAATEDPSAERPTEISESAEYPSLGDLAATHLTGVTILDVDTFDSVDVLEQDAETGWQFETGGPSESGAGTMVVEGVGPEIRVWHRPDRHAVDPAVLFRFEIPRSDLDGDSVWFFVEQGATARDFRNLGLAIDGSAPLPRLHQSNGVQYVEKVFPADGPVGIETDRSYDLLLAWTSAGELVARYWATDRPEAVAELSVDAEYTRTGNVWSPGFAVTGDAVLELDEFTMVEFDDLRPAPDEG